MEKTNNECQGCGYVIDPKEKRCPYCGTYNSNYVEPSIGKSAISSIVKLTADNHEKIEERIKRSIELGRKIFFVIAVSVVVIFFVTFFMIIGPFHF